MQRILPIMVPLLMGLPGCATPPVDTDPDAAARLTEVSYDAETETTRYWSPEIRSENLFQAATKGEFWVAKLACFLDEEHRTCRLFVKAESNFGYYNFHSAFDAENRRYVVGYVGSNTDCDYQYRYGGCIYTEHAVVSLSFGRIAEYSGSPMEIRLIGKAGRVIVTVPGPLIEGFVRRVETDRHVSGGPPD